MGLLGEVLKQTTDVLAYVSVHGISRLCDVSLAVKSSHPPLLQHLLTSGKFEASGNSLQVYLTEYG